MKKNGKSRDPEHVEATMQCWGCDVAGIFQSIYRLQRHHMWLWQAWRGLDKLLRVWIKEIRKFNSHLFIEATRMSEVDTYLIKSKRIAKKKVNTCVLFNQTASIHSKKAASGKIMLHTIWWDDKLWLDQRSISIIQRKCY